MGDQPIVTIVPDYAALSRVAADRVAAVVAQRPDAALALPTGNTPLGLFRELIRRAAEGEIDLSRAEFFCLDEYLGVGPGDPNSLTGWLQHYFFGPAGIAPERIHTLPSTDPDPVHEAAAYEESLRRHGGLALAVLGLGANGHIAYNEPGSVADSRTRVIDLTSESMIQAAAYWQGAVPIPHRAMTVGVGTLLEAERIVLIVAGAAKAPVLGRVLHDPPSADIPASWLRLAGSRLEVIADLAAMGGPQG